MSSNVKDVLDILDKCVKSIILLLLSICGYVGGKCYVKLEETHAYVLRHDSRLDGIDGKNKLYDQFLLSQISNNSKK
jgi:hypothetical protein